MQNFMGCMNIIGFSNLMDGCKKVGKADPNDIKKKKRLHQYAQLIFFCTSFLEKLQLFLCRGGPQTLQVPNKEKKML